MRFFPIRLAGAFFLAGAVLSYPARADPPVVVASIKPVHSLVAAVMEGVAEPNLLTDGTGSPHAQALRPSQARALQGADIVVWVGAGLETFLVRPLESLAADARIVTLMEADGVALLRARSGGAWDGHAADRHGDFDTHIWLDPRNAAAVAEALSDVLVEMDPDNAPTYRANAARLRDALGELEESLNQRLRAVRDRPFIVFHDAYQYFERRFAVSAVGGLTVSPETQPGAARLRDLRRTIAETQARCIFSEPQFRPRLVEAVVEGTGARSATLDPLGADLAAGPAQYFALLDAMAGSLVDCLGSQGAD